LRVFSYLYNKTLQYAKSKYASYWLGGISFVESFILPYPPPDVLLAPMVLSDTNKAYKYAFICTIFSVLGGVVGYLIGAQAIELLEPLFQKLGYMSKIDTILNWFNDYGIAIVFLAGFSPLPYKIFTIGAGIAGIAFTPFVLISLISRGARFFLVAYLAKRFGKDCDIWLQKYIDKLGYILIALVILAIIIKSY